MNRRGFLKLLGWAPLAAALPSLPKPVHVWDVVALTKEEIAMQAVEKIINPPFVVGHESAVQMALRDLAVFGTGAVHITPMPDRVMVDYVPVKEWLKVKKS